MKILLSNDDGISSLGIQALKKVLSSEFDVYLSAPSKERSATSQALTIFKKLIVEKHDDKTYSVGGFPTDSVNVALFGKIFPEMNMVISGINRGVNMGHDVHYSGTVGAARHGAVHGLYSIAVSSGNREENYDYIKEAEYILQFLKNQFLALKKGIVYNINFPIEFSKNLSDLKLTKLGKRTYSDEYHINPISEKKSQYLLALTELGYVVEEGTDFEAFYNHQVSLSPIHLDTTHDDELIELQNSFF